MAAISLLGFACFIAAGLAVGTRLLRLWRRTRQVPELAIGNAYLWGGTGYGLVVLASLKPFPASGNWWLMVAGVFGLNFGIVWLLIVVWQVFRPTADWARALVAAGSVGTLVAFTAIALTLQPDGRRGPVGFWTMIATGGLAYLWAVLESFRYWGLMRRRLRLGLADAELTQRFLCWGLSAAAVLLVFFAGAVNRFLVDVGVHPTVLALQAALGFASAVSVWLAFFPPAFYRGWLLGSAPAPRA